MQYLEGERESLNGIGPPHLVDDLVEVFKPKQASTTTETPIMTNYLLMVINAILFYI